MEDRGALEWIAGILVVIGAINWGLVGIGSFSAINYNWDILSLILGGVPWLAAIIYILIGLSGIWMLIRVFK